MISARTSLRLFSVVLLALALSAFAAPASDFSGTYTLGAAAAAGKDVQLTIMLTVANNTSSSIGNATISLHEPQAGRVIYGQLAGSFSCRRQQHSCQRLVSRSAGPVRVLAKRQQSGHERYVQRRTRQSRSDIHSVLSTPFGGNTHARPNFHAS